MKKKSTQTIVTEISDSVSTTLKPAENGGTELAVLQLTVFVVLNTRCSRKTLWGALYLRPRGLDLPGHVFSAILKRQPKESREESKIWHKKNESSCSDNKLKEWTICFQMLTY